jgi:hypothetical protein
MDLQEPQRPGQTPGEVEGKANSVFASWKTPSFSSKYNNNTQKIGVNTMSRPQQTTIVCEWSQHICVVLHGMQYTGRRLHGYIKPPPDSVISIKECEQVPFALS